MDKVAERHGAAGSNLLLHGDGFRIIVCKRGYGLRLHKDLQIIPSPTNDIRENNSGMSSTGWVVGTTKLFQD